MANQPNPASGGNQVGRVSSERMLAIGWLLMGLLAGLLIGWVVWPVQWADAGPDDLRPDARAHFISATADAYVASGGQDPNTALARMQSFDDPQAAIGDAIAFFRQSDDPKRMIREVNLRSLASAMGPSAMGSAEVPLPGLLPAQADTPEISWTNWLLGILTGLLLLVGGGWIIRRLLIDRRSAAVAPAGATSASQTSWVPPLPPTSPTTQPSQNTGGWQPSAPPDQTDPLGLGQAAQASRSVQMETWDDPGDAPAFAEPAFAPTSPSSARPRPFPSPLDEDEPLRRVLPGQRRAAPFEPDTDAETNAAASVAGREQPRSIRTVVDLSPTALDQEDDDEDFDDDFDADTDDDDDDDGWESWEPERELPTLRKVIPVAVEDDDDEEIDWPEDWADRVADIDDSDDGGWELDEDEDEDEDVTGVSAHAGGGTRPALAPPAEPGPDEDDDAESGILPTVQSVLSNLGWGQKEGAPKGRDGKAIGSYIAEYNIGIMAYDQSFTITSTGAEEDTPLGACGMAISEELDKSAANSNNVRVLQVWLYDGVEVRTSSQYLVSPGVDKEALGEEAKSAGTITGEPLDIAPGVTFRIPAKNLLLDCRIVSADFLTTDAQPSPLRTVRVEMTARAAK
jgi:hypothetical protein